jgi:amino acid transporter
MSILDVAIYNFAIFGLPFATYFTMGFIPVLGGNFLEAMLISAILGIFVIYAYYCFQVVMPRSSGDYIFISRTLFGSLGFVSNAGYVLITVIYIGINGVLIQSTGFSVLFALLGGLYNNSTMVSLASAVNQPGWLFVLGTIETLVVGSLAIFGKRAYFTVQNVAYIIVIIGMFVLVGLLATSSNQSFQAAFNAYSAHYTNSTDYYDAIISIATKNGWSPPDTNNFYNTMLLLPPLTAYGIGFYFSSYLGGEIKNTRKTSLFGNYASFAFVIIFETILTLVAYNTLGYNWLSALDSQLTTGNLSLPVIPYLNFLALVLTSNPLIIIFVVMVGILQLLIFVPAAVILISRSFMAYSFDRILPEAFSRVSDRWHTPVIAVVFGLALGELALILLDIPLTAAGVYLFTTVALWYVALLPVFVVGLSAAVFPYLKKQIFESSAVNQRVAGIPLMSIGGLGTMIYSLIVVYLSLSNPIFGANGEGAIATLVVVVVLLFVLYFGSKYVRKRSGIDLGLVFHEIPPE